MSDLRVNSIAGRDGTSPATLVKQSAAKAYHRLASNVLTKAFNVSSITDNGTGDRTVNLTSAMDSVNYSATATAGNAGNSINTATFTANSFRTVIRNNAGSSVDSDTSSSVLGDLA